ncbi:universal stress protein [Alkalibacter rhizosphaerae]|uniref:Universal stress protein n=1 Tax=Alkalibacter rhizosphaerae TaxID=2815577 RepID=A0A974XFJ4_9FIRM|nr:universal stress protein [Alkalibacter rhizosphaerae]QSX08893.1 universal stress protein [Alkalibacter rhizosphaerae]
MKRVLIPVDGSEYSMRALEKAKEIALAFESDIVLINVKDIRFPLYPYEPGNVIDMGATIDQLAETASKNAQRILDDAAQVFEDIPGDVETFELDGEPGNRIIKFIEEDPDIDLVIMGSLGVNGGLQSFLLGSVTNKVLHHVDRAVLVVK